MGGNATPPHCHLKTFAVITPRRTPGTLHDYAGSVGAPERGTQADRIYAEIRGWIVQGELAEGEELNQVALAKHFGVSRIPVREALQRLQAERLLTSEPFRRHQVTRLSADDVDELMAIRSELECLALRRHGTRLGPADLADLSGLNESLRAESDPQQWLATDWEFHRRLAGGDTALADFIGDVRHRIHRYLNAAARMGARHASAVNEHAGVLEALEASDLPAAEARLRHHIQITAEALKQLAAG